MSVRPKADPSLGWAYRPDEITRTALASGVKKFREHPELGSDRPHEAGDMTKALAVERKLIEKSKPKPTKRKKKVAKKVHKLKDLAERSKKRVKVDVEEVRSPEKKAKSKLVPLKAICAALEIDPKAARVKLRRLIATGKIDFHDQSQRWEFTQSQAKEIKEHLS